MTCSHFGSHSASSHRPEQQQPSSQPEVSGAMGQEESRSEEMDLAQIQELCILFMKECPSGALHLHEFKRIFGVPSSSAEESLYIETIFRSFDTNQVRGRDPASGLWPLGSGLQALFFQRILFSACRTTRWTSWSTWRHCTSSCGGTWRTDSSGPSRCTTRTGTGSWTATRSSGSSRSDLRSDPQNRIHTSNPGFHNVSRCTVSTAAISEHLYLPNGLSATSCYVILVGLRFYFRCSTDPLFS